MNTQEVLDELVQELAKMQTNFQPSLRGSTYIDGYAEASTEAIRLILTKKQQVQNLEDYNNKSLNLIKSYFTSKNTIE